MASVIDVRCPVVSDVASGIEVRRDFFLSSDLSVTDEYIVYSLRVHMSILRVAVWSVPVSNSELARDADSAFGCLEL